MATPATPFGKVRAAEIWAERGLQWNLTGKLTPGEDAYVALVWASMGGESCWMDAFFCILRGEFDGKVAEAPAVTRGKVWRLMGLSRMPGYPTNCDNAFHCATCGTPRAWHELGAKTADGIYLCDEACAKSLRTGGDSNHDSDSDCFGQLDDASECRGCHVFHGDPCPSCGQRGYHDRGCPAVERLGRNTVAKARRP